MHRTIKGLLSSAKGQAAHVIAVNVDIRGFSAFSERVDSLDAARYLRSVYTRMLDDYYPDSTFFKLTGDGLLLIFRVPDGELPSLAESVLLASYRLLSEFGSLATSDPMVNPDVPSHVGIGVAFGPATRIHAGAKTLDYSGRVLNLASRLMGLARPTGLVIDATRLGRVIPAALSTELVTDAVYLPGIAERQPLSILATRQTSIPASAKQPLQEFTWVKDEQEFRYSQILPMAPRYHFPLSRTPTDASQIRASLVFPDRPTGRRKRTKFPKGLDVSAQTTYHTGGSDHFVEIDLDTLRGFLKTQNLLPTDMVNVTVSYPATPRRRRRRRGGTSPTATVKPQASRG